MPVEAVDAAASLAKPLEAFVMEHERRAAPRGLNVELYPMLGLDRGPKRRPAVLDPAGAVQPAMRERLPGQPRRMTRQLSFP